MTDKEILQGIDRLDAELPFDEICVGGKDNWHDIDVHELLYEVKERINQWHYPSKGEYPTESGNYFAACKTDDGLLARFIKFYDARFKKWESHIEVYAWCELPDPPKDASLEKQVWVPYSYLLNQPAKEEE